MRTETLHAKNQTLNPKYATTLTTIRPARISAATHNPAQFRHKQRRPFIRTL